MKNFKLLQVAISISTFLFITLTFAGTSHQNNFDELLPSQVLCSSMYEIPVGKCTGSAYCSACKNCKYCKYCNSGGSCGVCGKRPVRSYSSPPRPKETSPNTSNTKTQPKKKLESKYPQVEIKNIFAKKKLIYIVIQATSLRESAGSQYKVLKRLQVNDEVEVVQSLEGYWWKVDYKGQTGWVKKHLLKQKAIIHYP